MRFTLAGVDVYGSGPALKQMLREKPSSTLLYKVLFLLRITSVKIVSVIVLCYQF